MKQAIGFVSMILGLCLLGTLLARPLPRPTQPGVFDCSTAQGRDVTAFVQTVGGQTVAVNLCQAATDKEVREFQRDLRKAFRSLVKNDGTK